MFESILGIDPIKALLEENDPIVKFLTLKHLVEKDPTDPELLSARERVIGIYTSLLNAQHPAGYWFNPKRPFDYYSSSEWVLLMLTEIGFDCSYPQIQKGCQWLLDNYVNANGEVKVISEKGKDYTFSCEVANVLRLLLAAGFSDSAKVKAMIQWLCEKQRPDGGWLHCPINNYFSFLKLPFFTNCEKGLKRDSDPAVHSCMYATINALWAFSKLKPAEIDETIKNSILNGVRFLLAHRLYRSHIPPFQVTRAHNWLHNQGFTKLSFPVKNQYNILLGLYVLTQLGINNEPRMQDALDIVVSRMLPDGLWVLEANNVGDFYAMSLFDRIRLIGKPNKLLTYRALQVIKAISGVKPPQ